MRWNTGVQNNFARLLLAPALMVCLGMFGCQTTNGDGGTESEAGPPAAAGGATVKREQMELDIQVEGATATRTGDRTITLDYPVLDDKNLIIPDWVINPGIGGVLGAVGVASKNTLGTREQLDEARLSARLELSSMLEIRLQKVGRTELEENIFADASGRSEDSRKTILGVDRDILDNVLAGSRQRALWFDPDSGECYLWLVLDGAVLKKADHYVTEGVSVFVANTPITTEYLPDRKKPEPPKVTVEVEAPPPAPEPVKGPIEKLEDSLKPIETIPIEAGKAKKK